MSENQPLLKQQEQEFALIEELNELNEYLHYCLDREDAIDYDWDTWDYWFSEETMTRKQIIDRENALSKLEKGK